MTNDGVLLPEVKRHYMRIRPPEKGEAYCLRELRDGDASASTTGRRGRGYEFEAREIIDGGFLELVRYGVRRADDPLMVDSLKVVDAVLKRDLPQGPGWLRYNWDGYGDSAGWRAVPGLGPGPRVAAADRRARALRAGGGPGHCAADPAPTSALPPAGR